MANITTQTDEGQRLETSDGAGSSPTSGGSAAAKEAAARLRSQGIQTATVQNLTGPSAARHEDRINTHTYTFNAEDLPGFAGNFLRSSVVVVEPGGLVPVHPHKGRPGVLVVVEGTIVEHRSDGTSTILGPRDYTFGVHGVAHWWENESGEDPVRIWVVDLCTVEQGCEAGQDGGVIDLGTGDGDTVMNPPSGEGASKVEVLGTIDLSAEYPDRPAVGRRHLRLRRLEFEPGHIIPAHDHEGRPTYVWQAQGTWTFHGPDGDQTVEQGTVFLEHGALPHAWSNTGTDTVVLYAVDVVIPDD